jgi:hypothetical protein
VTTLGWLRFEWDLRTLSAEETNVPPPFMLRGAEKGEGDAVETVVSNAFSMDTGWSDIQRMVGTVIVRDVHAGFASDPPACIIIQHGHRVIAASVVNSREGVENHLSTGPCVLQQYRGRGLGTVLFRDLARRFAGGRPRPSRRNQQGKIDRGPLPLSEVRRHGKPLGSGF